MSSPIFTTNDFQIPCPECKGMGKATHDGRNMPCIKCEGKGFILTSLGQTLLHFVKSNL
jgi:DnaJ-class molecular chaperone